ncbi:MAG: MOSC domain-containing protein [Candidatus Dormiibacter spiritus]|nr:MAG: MOSC domain-containing protein [Candidatus Dormibacteraeota bacterium]
MVQGSVISTDAGQLTAVHVGRPTSRVTPEGKSWRSAFVKQPTAGPVWLDWENLAENQQADLGVHRGPDMAVLGYSADHYPLWRAELDLAELGPGGFGENFTIAGQDEHSVCLGDVYELGEAIVQVSQSRGPCFKISRRWNRPDLSAESSTPAGTAGISGCCSLGWWRLDDRPYPRWTVRRAADTLQLRKRDPAAARALLECEVLGAGGRRDLAEPLLRSVP